MNIVYTITDEAEENYLSDHRKWISIEENDPPLLWHDWREAGGVVQALRRDGFPSKIMPFDRETMSIIPSHTPEFGLHS